MMISKTITIIGIILIATHNLYSQKINFEPNSKGSEIASEIRKLVSKPFDYPLELEVSGFKFYYHPPLADNHVKSPWHKVLFSKESNDSTFVIFELILKEGSWVDSNGTKISDLSLWLKETKSKISPKKICLTLKFNSNDSPFANVNEFKTIYHESCGRYFFDLTDR